MSSITVSNLDNWVFPELWYDIWLIAIHYLRLFIKFYGKYESTKKWPKSALFWIFGPRQKFSQNIDYRNKSLNSSSFGYEIAENITLIAQKFVVLTIMLKNNDSRYKIYAPVENANPIVMTDWQGVRAWNLVNQSHFICHLLGYSSFLAIIKNVELTGLC